jgi:hypothetical protein
MTKHPSFKGGTVKHECPESSNGAPTKKIKICQKNTTTNSAQCKEVCMADLPVGVIDLIAKFAFNTKPELKEFKTLNVPKTKTTKTNMEALLADFKHIFHFGMLSRENAKKVLGVILDKKPEEIKDEFGDEYIILDFAHVVMESLDKLTNTPLTLLSKKADGLGNALIITYNDDTNTNNKKQHHVYVYLDESTEEEKIKNSKTVYSYSINIKQLPPNFENFDNMQKDSAINTSTPIRINDHRQGYPDIDRTKYGNYAMLKNMFDILYIDIPKILKLGDTDWYISKAMYHRYMVENQNSVASYTEVPTEYRPFYTYSPSGGRRNFRKTTPPSRNPKTSPVGRKATTSATTNATRRSTSSSGVNTRRS